MHRDGKHQIRLGLALGGGAARGLAHIGILRVLEQEGIPISVIAGSSIGAIIGGLYAYYRNVDEVEDHVIRIIRHPVTEKLGLQFIGEEGFKLPREFDFEDVLVYFKLQLSLIKVFNKPYFFDPELVNELYSLLPDPKIENLPLRFGAVATDLISAKEILFQKGSFRKALKASSAIPGIFPPVKYRNYQLVDGATTNAVPVEEAREMGADVVIAVDVSKDIHWVRNIDNALGILYRVDEIASYLLTQRRLREANLVLIPDVGRINWADFSTPQAIIQKGEQVARRFLPQIRELIERGGEHKPAPLERIKTYVESLWAAFRKS